MARRTVARSVSTSVHETPPRSDSVAPRSPAVSVSLAVALFLLAAIARCVGVGKDLWLDEIWSVQVATQMRSPLDVFTLHHEINHHLNSLWLYAIGADGTSLAYHLLSLVSGIASVGVAGLIGLRRGAATALCAIVLLGFSYELVLFSSEARGYSTLVLSCLLSFFCLENYLERRRPRWAIAYAVSTLLGLLSHPIFAGFLGAAFVWTAARLVRSASTRGEALRGIAIVQGVPLLCFVALYLVDLRHVVPGGGTPNDSLIDAYGTSLAWALGTPQRPAVALVGCIVAVVGLDYGLRWLRREQSDAWIFYVAAIVVFPIALVLARRSNLVYTRHFLVAAVFLLMLMAWVLGQWWEKGHRVRCATIVILYCVANGWHVLQLARYGRGEYREAIRYMAENTAGPVVTVGGDQDFRIGTELSYYLPRELVGKEGRYFQQGTWPAEGPQWLITQRESVEPATAFQNQYTDGAGHEYDLVRTFPTAPLSGLHWFVYRNRTLK